MVTESPGTIPCGADVATVTVFDARAIDEIFATMSLTAATPAPGPTWLTRSKFVPSYWRGTSIPNWPSCTATYSRPNRDVELAVEFAANPVAICDKTPGEFSPHNVPAESSASSV